MKKLLCLITTVLFLLLLLVGCSSEDASLENYALVKEDGAYYVIMDREDPTKDEIGYLPVPHIDFDSFEEMIADFQNGDFSEHELDFLARHPRTEDGKILVPNLDELIEPVLPDDVGDYEIIQLGDSYYFDCNDPYNLTLYLTPGSYENNVKQFSDFEETQEKNNNYEIDVSATHLEERNATEYTWVKSTHTRGDLFYRYVLYTIEANGTTYYVTEQYATNNTEQIYGVKIAFTYQGQDVLVSVLDMDSRPSIDWIASFAVKPYEG